MSWSPEVAAEEIKQLGLKSGNPKKAAVFKKVAKIVALEDLNGALLLAGGSEMLVDRCFPVVHKSRKTVKIYCNEIASHIHFLQESLEQLHVSEERAGYWDKLREQGAAAERELIEDFKGSKMEKALKLVLTPFPVESIEYTFLKGLSSCSVSHVSRRVRNAAKSFGEKGDSKKGDSKKTSEPAKEAKHSSPIQLFKVVSVSLEDDPAVIHRNFIYVSSRPIAQQRKSKKKLAAGAGSQGFNWVLMTSVDFATHGRSAPPGHFHLNRSPDGQQIEHWSQRSMDNAVFHGHPTNCPVWWHLIPKTASYHKQPLTTLLTQVLDNSHNVTKD